MGLVFIFFMLTNLKKRMNGSSIMHLLQDENSSQINRFVGKLRIAVDSCENLPRYVASERSERAVRTPAGATTRHLRIAHFAIRQE